MATLTRHAATLHDAREIAKAVTNGRFEAFIDGPFMAAPPAQRWRITRKRRKTVETAA